MGGDKETGTGRGVENQVQDQAIDIPAKTGILGHKISGTGFDKRQASKPTNCRFGGADNLKTAKA